MWFFTFLIFTVITEHGQSVVPSAPPLIRDNLDAVLANLGIRMPREAMTRSGSGRILTGPELPRIKKSRKTLFSASQLANKMILFLDDNNRRTRDFIAGKYSDDSVEIIDYLADVSTTWTRFSLDFSLASGSRWGLGAAMILDMTVNPLFKIQALFKEVHKQDVKKVIETNYRAWISSVHNGDKSCPVGSNPTIMKLSYRSTMYNFTDTTPNKFTAHIHPGVVSKPAILVKCFDGIVRSEQLSGRHFERLSGDTWVLENFIDVSHDKIDIMCGSEQTGIITVEYTGSTPSIRPTIRFGIRQDSSTLCLDDPGRVSVVDMTPCPWNPNVMSETTFVCSDLHEIDWTYQNLTIQTMFGLSLSNDTKGDHVLDLSKPASVIRNCVKTLGQVCELGMFSKFPGKMSVTGRGKITTLRLKCQECTGCSLQESKRGWIINMDSEGNATCDQVTIKWDKIKSDLSDGYVEYSMYPINYFIKTLSLPISYYSALHTQLVSKVFEGFKLKLEVDGKTSTGTWKHHGHTELPEHVFTFNMTDSTIVIYDLTTDMITINRKAAESDKLMTLSLESFGKVCDENFVQMKHMKWCDGNGQDTDVTFKHVMNAWISNDCPDCHKSVPSPNMTDMINTWRDIVRDSHNPDIITYMKEIPGLRLVGFT
ncbi:hypothetical protein [Salmon gill poxvirus]